ncbi:hypothetical protein DFH11DRAFT_1605213, partial [Phellopilus nigrolimitatus]
MPSQQQQQQQQQLRRNLSTLVRTRTVIDQPQTLLYCSEVCRKKDLESFWLMPIPSAC